MDRPSQYTTIKLIDTNSANSRNESFNIDIYRFQPNHNRYEAFRWCVVRFWIFGFPFQYFNHLDFKILNFLFSDISLSGWGSFAAKITGYPFVCVSDTFFSMDEIQLITEECERIRCENRALMKEINERNERMMAKIEDIKQPTGFQSKGVFPVSGIRLAAPRELQIQLIGANTPGLYTPFLSQTPTYCLLSLQPCSPKRSRSRN